MDDDNIVNTESVTTDDISLLIRRDHVIHPLLALTRVQGNQSTVRDKILLDNLDYLLEKLLGESIGYIGITLFQNSPKNDFMSKEKKQQIALFAEKLFDKDPDLIMVIFGHNALAPTIRTNGVLSEKERFLVCSAIGLCQEIASGNKGTIYFGISKNIS